MSAGRISATLASLAVAGGSVIAIPGAGDFLTSAANDFATRDMTTKLGVLSGVISLFGFPGLLMALPFFGRVRREMDRHARETQNLADLNLQTEKMKAEAEDFRDISPAEVIRRGGDGAGISMRAAGDLDLALTHFVRLVLETTPDISDLKSARAAMDAVSDAAQDNELINRLETKLQHAEHGAGLREDAPGTGMSIAAMIAAAERAVIEDGQYELGLRLAGRAVAEARASGAEKTIAGFRALFERARALMFLGRYSEALTALEDSLPIQKEVLGPRHPNVLGTRFLIAQTLRRLGRHEEALTALENLLPIFEEIFGSRDPGIFSVRLEIAQTLGGLERYEEALTALKDLLPIREDVEGPRHPQVLFTRSQIAPTLNGLGRPEEALTALEDLLPIQEEVLGPRHPNVLKTRFQIAQTLCSLERYEEALTALEDLLPIQEEVLGPRHPYVLDTEFHIAITRYHLGQKTEALRLMKEVQAISREVLPEGYPALRGQDDWIAVIERELSDEDT